ncbi:hypothetical protein [Microbacterium album]|uniref:Uncharacterized protein n=1 Tax=Microbacterium album TaxID=2053191 RepID=A0A917MLC2_9MICO|nr:hypothetical protein [Microbacterium album]GGH41545.1 hypothetical protein GCM10010921_14210 [Microbacterium album]
MIFATGMLSLVTDRDVIDTPGLGPVPGPLAVGVSAGAFALSLRPALRVDRPAYSTAVGVALAAALAHLAGLWLLAVVFGADLGRAVAAAAGAATSWTSAAFAGCAAVAAWAAIAVRRTAARPPRWPWEDDPEE